MIELHERRKWAHAKLVASFNGNGQIANFQHVQARQALKSALESMFFDFDRYELNAQFDYLFPNLKP